MKLRIAETILESKVDQQLFIDKFGEKSFDDFQKYKQRIKNKGYSPDLTYHTKNTSVEDMGKILSAVSDDVREKEVDVEGKQIPEDNGNYKVVAKDSEWTIYQPWDYISSIHCANGARWCTAGGYEVPEGKVKVSQAKEFFNRYVHDYSVVLYYCINNNNNKDSVAVVCYPNVDDINYFDYNDHGVSFENLPSSLVNLLQDNGIVPPDFDVVSTTLTGYNGVDVNVVIPEGVTKIGTCAFENCDFIESVVFPDSLTYIGDGAFFGCDSLNKLNIPNNVTYVGETAFKYCTSLKSVTIPDNLKNIEVGAFSDCTSLTNINIPNGIKYIDDYAFCDCISLKFVTIPNSVEFIGFNSFINCGALTDVIIGNGVNHIDIGAFDYCSNIIIHTKNQYVIEYCEDNEIKYDTNIKETYRRGNMKLRIIENDELSDEISEDERYALELELGELRRGYRLTDPPEINKPKKERIDYILSILGLGCTKPRKDYIKPIVKNR